MAIYNEVLPCQPNAREVEAPIKEPLSIVKNILMKPKLTVEDLVAAVKLLDQERVKRPCDQEITGLFLEIYAHCNELH